MKNLSIDDSFARTCEVRNGIDPMNFDSLIEGRNIKTIYLDRRCADPQPCVWIAQLLGKGKLVEAACETRKVTVIDEPIQCRRMNAMH